MSLRWVTLAPIAAIFAACGGSSGLLPLGELDLSEAGATGTDASSGTQADATMPGSGQDAASGGDAPSTPFDAGADAPGASGGNEGGLPEASPSGPCVPSSATSTVYVDPANGTDDRNHGGGKGACAYKTLTYALDATQGSAREIDLASGTYSAATGETLPFVLTGRQKLACALATLEGEALWASGPAVGDANRATVVLDGTSNTLDHCKIAGDRRSTQAGNCVLVATDGAANAPHTITYGDIQACGFLGARVNGTQLVVNETSLYNSANGIGWLAGADGGRPDPTGQLDQDWFSGNTDSDIYCADTDPGVTGATNHIEDPCVGCSNCGAFR
jgi:hypothetical protein